MAFSRMATWQSSMATSTIEPMPVVVRWWRAATTPRAANMPAVMSPIEVPTRVGSPPSGPVMLMIPPSAWTTMS